jgi:hypothetical protein
MRLIPEDLLRSLMQRGGELPPPGNDRWGKAVKLDLRTPSYCVVNVGYSGSVPTPWALSLSFSLDNKTYTPSVPPTYTGNILVEVIRAADVKAGPLADTYLLKPGDALPVCTFLGAALTVNVTALGEPTPDIFVHAIAAPTTMVDCDSIVGPGANEDAWNDVSATSAAASTVGVFTPIAADPTTKSIIVQNNTNTDLLLGLGSFLPGNGPPPFSNIILPGGLNAIWSVEGFTGAINAIFAAVGSAAQYATFTRGIKV